MTNDSQLAKPLEGDLGGGLFLRWSTMEDKEKIAHFLGMVFRESADELFNRAMADQLYTTMRPDFPFSGPEDWAIVEDRSKPGAPIVASTVLWNHEWSYAGISFGVGRPEFVATDPAYRNRGLIRAIFGLLHEKSAAKGHLMQGITGIPYFYRLFGYEYVLDLDASRTVQVAQIPDKTNDDPEPYTLHFATAADIKTLIQLYEQEREESLVWHHAPASYWQLLINLWDEPGGSERDPLDVGWKYRPSMILDRDGNVCGFVSLPVRRTNHTFSLSDVFLFPHVNVANVAPVMLRMVKEIGQSVPSDNPKQPLTEINLRLGREHPLYDVVGAKMAVNFRNPYAWYIRIPDVSAFIHKIAPVLEERLTQSILVGYTGECKLDFYRSGLLLSFEKGSLKTVKPWRPEPFENANAGCPPLIFLQLLLGYRSLAELNEIFPDVWANHNSALLLDILFPKMPSRVHPLA